MSTNSSGSYFCLQFQDGTSNTTTMYGKLVNQKLSPCHHYTCLQCTKSLIFHFNNCAFKFVIDEECLFRVFVYVSSCPRIYSRHPCVANNSCSYLNLNHPCSPRSSLTTSTENCLTVTVTITHCEK